MIKFDVDKSEALLIDKIANRVLQEFQNYPDDKMTLVMDITACHCSGMDLMLSELLHAKSFDLAHDIGGIRRHINRRTGKIEDNFVPRYHLSNGKIVALAMTVADGMAKKKGYKFWKDEQ